MDKQTQIANTVLMVSPDTFGFNPETAITNQFSSSIEDRDTQIKAGQEFERMVSTLKDNKIDVIVIPSKKNKITPDAVFPNNWLTTFSDGTLIISSMVDRSRQKEKQPDLLKKTLIRAGFKINKVIDLSSYEKEGLALEGTGSIVFSRKSNHAFSVESARTSHELFFELCRQLNYTPILFHAYHKSMSVYHTNLMMTIGDGFSVICSEIISDSHERTMVLNYLENLRLEVIDISKDQIQSFCGNILHLNSTNNKKKIVMSQVAYNAFTDKQKENLANYGELVSVDISTIEKVGGGSARCMMAEIFLPKSENE